MIDEKSRLTLQVVVPVREQIERLQEETGAASMKEVVTRAVELFDIVVKAKQEGKEVLVVNGDKITQIKLY